HLRDGPTRAGPDALEVLRNGTSGLQKGIDGERLQASAATLLLPRLSSPREEEDYAGGHASIEHAGGPPPAPAAASRLPVVGRNTLAPTGGPWTAACQARRGVRGTHPAGRLRVLGHSHRTPSGR